MNRNYPSYTVVTAYRTIRSFADEIYNAMVEFHPFFSDFHALENEFKILHSGILALLQDMRAPLFPFIRLGLRNNEGWENPPASSAEAHREVERILSAMTPWVRRRNGRVIDQQSSLFHPAFAVVIDYLQSIEPVTRQNGLDPVPEEQVPGATDEQIASLPVHVATDENTNHGCTICLEKFTVGQEINTLPCTHQFHHSCIESWLKQCAICPMDRSRVFPN